MIRKDSFPGSLCLTALPVLEPHMHPRRASLSGGMRTLFDGKTPMDSSLSWTNIHHQEEPDTMVPGSVVLNGVIHF